MKKFLHQAISTTLLISLVFVSILPILTPQQANAQLGNIVGGFATCALSGQASALFDNLLGDIGDLGGIFDSIGGLAVGDGFGDGGGGGGNEVPVSDDDVQGTTANILKVDKADLEIQKSLEMKEYILDCLVWAVVQGILEEITGSTINWYNKGLDGDPYYLIDPDQFFANLEDQATLDFFSTDFADAPIPSNFKSNVEYALSRDRTRISSSQRLECPEGNRIDNLFVEGDATEGWDGYLRTVANPACTPIGSYALAHNEMTRQVASVRDEAETFIDIGDGTFPEVEDGQVITPGVVIKDQIAELLESPVTQLENSDELSELIGAVLDYIGGIFGESSSLRESDTSGLTGSSGIDSDTDFVPPPPGELIDYDTDTGSSSFDDARVNQISGFIAEMRTVVQTDTDLGNFRRNQILTVRLPQAIDGLGDLDFALSVGDSSLVFASLDDIEQALDLAENLYDGGAIGVVDEAQLSSITEGQIRPIWEGIRNDFGLGLVWNVLSG